MSLVGEHESLLTLYVAVSQSTGTSGILIAWYAKHRLQVQIALHAEMLTTSVPEFRQGMKVHGS